MELATTYGTYYHLPRASLPMEKIGILIADDHPAFREGLARLLGEEKDLEVVALAGNGEEAVTLARELVPQVVIIDITMPGINGIEATKRIKAACPTTSILILSAYEYDSYVIGAIRAGAAGYMSKNVLVSQIAATVRAIRAGEAVLDSKAAAKVFRRLEYNTRKGGGQELQPRELEVLKLAAKGMSNKQIAQGLVISVRTVQTHLVSIFNKLEVGSRTEAVLHALKEGWLTLDDLS